MKKLLLGFLAAVCATAAWAAPAQEKVEFAIFVSPSCVHCKHFENEYLPVLQEKYKDSVHFVIYDISKDGNNLILAETAKAHGKRPAYPTALVGDTYMVGYPHEIKTYAEAAIEKAQLLQQKTQVSTQKQDTQTAFKKITFWAIIGAGLVDGINPCAFAVIVFFVSFLTVYKYTRKEVIVVGTSYCVAVFIAYVLIGLGLFQFLYAMRGFYWVIKAFYWITALLCLGFFVLSLYDFWIYQKTKKSDKMLLQLPTNLKVRIHKIMGFFLREKHDSVWRLTLAALAVGFCVSLVEAVCTGQVYMPTVVLIMQDPAFRVKAVIYLLLYNLMFIVPLIAVFSLAVAGYESKGFSDFFKKHLGLTKLLLCVVFLGLFALLATNL
ncbi:thioredoxin domain-containing protein [Candidatus Avelusimicrobium facis]|uniref:thioredoxin domain-containing protein n=1 Tax=Candidatus Avelusimicrobium facis TaxID=3416203 RepID=UPI003D0F05F9